MDTLPKTIRHITQHLGIARSLVRKGASDLIGSPKFSPIDKRDEKSEDAEKMIKGTKETVCSSWEGQQRSPVCL